MTSLTDLPDFSALLAACRPWLLLLCLWSSNRVLLAQQIAFGPVPQGVAGRLLHEPAWSADLAWTLTPRDYEVDAPPPPPDFSGTPHLDLHFGSEARPIAASETLWQKLTGDAANFYDRETLALLLVGVGAHAALSNTNSDWWLRHEYQERIRSARTDEWTEAFHNPKVFGEGTYALPAYAAAAVLGWRAEDGSWRGTVAEWGERSLRTFVVGAPSLVALQWTIGASRPTEEHSQSHWEPFQDDNGLSGHAFLGAIPFLSAAQMADDVRWKAMFYGASILPGFSRFNDDDHFASQVLLGWCLACLSAEAVNDTYLQSTRLRLIPYIAPGATGAGLFYEW